MTVRCPSLSQLPPAPLGKNGWPWTVQSNQLTDTAADGSEWPRLTIVTPSYNQAEFVEETIRSILLQGYPNLEYIIIDGGSTDGSLDIIHRYEPWIAYWISEPDDGHIYALRKGFARATGEFLGWQNSDDYYAPNVFGEVAQSFKKSYRIDLVYGNVRIVDHAGQQVDEMRFVPASYWTTLLETINIHNQAAFFRRSLWDRMGGITIVDDPSFDYELFIRALREANSRFIHRTLGNYRQHPGSITFSGETDHTDPWVFRRQHLGRLRHLPRWALRPVTWFSCARRALWYAILGDWDYLLRGLRRRVLGYPG